MYRGGDNVLADTVTKVQFLFKIEIIEDYLNNNNNYWKHPKVYKCFT